MGRGGGTEEVSISLREAYISVSVALSIDTRGCLTGVYGVYFLRRVHLSSVTGALGEDWRRTPFTHHNGNGC